MQKYNYKYLVSFLTIERITFEILVQNILKFNYNKFDKELFITQNKAS